MAENTEKRESLKERGTRCARKFFEARDYLIIEEDFVSSGGHKIDLVVGDDDVLVFVDVTICEDFDKGLPPEDIPGTRQRAEAAACAWLKEKADEPWTDCTVRFDMLGLLLVGPDRALVRHHINAFGGECTELG